VLLVAAFWSIGELSGEIERSASLDNFQLLASEPVYRSIAGRTIAIAALVTVTDAILAFPLAFYMAKVATPRVRAALVVAVMLPLWSAYLVKAFAWRTILSQGGPLDWALDPFGLSGPGYGLTAVWLVMSYLWLPYMTIPIYAGLERIPDSLLNASEDLHARPGYTFRRVILPLAFPAVVAGSIFTFSLTMGDFIAPSLVGSGEQFIGTTIFSTITTNLPLAAAFATVPIAVMVVYLLGARRLGAFEHV
jgi:putative spermidine/putrescine transport system permease protein